MKSVPEQTKVTAETRTATMRMYRLGSPPRPPPTPALALTTPSAELIAKGQNFGSRLEGLEGLKASAVSTRSRILSSRDWSSLFAIYRIGLKFRPVMKPLVQHLRFVCSRDLL